MPQSLTQIFVHIVFSTKQRRPFLEHRKLREEMHRYLGGTCNGLKCPVLRVGGVADHVHILCRLGSMVRIPDLVRELKRASSVEWNERRDQAMEFHWQSGYSAFSVSPSHVKTLIPYIDGQEEHHRVESFQDELRGLLREYGVEWDERYLWD